MKKIITKKFADELKLIFTEGVNYFNTSDESIWGEGDKDTFKVLKNYNFDGVWLNLAAGDGRYNNFLLKTATKVIVTDIDESSLSKLWHKTPNHLKEKLETQLLNLVEKFPFNDQTFDGIFCTGTLHLFKPDVLTKIFLEIDRVLKPGGKIFIDFATDVKRVLLDGQLKQKNNEAEYDLKTADKLMRKLLTNYQIKIRECSVPEEKVEINDQVSYLFSCNYLLITGQKNEH